MKGLLETQGYAATVIDIGPLGPPAIRAGYIERGGGPPGRMGALRPDSDGRAGPDHGSDGERGAASSFPVSFTKDRIDGVIGLGGNQGTAIASMAMRVLPFGFPKYLVSTVASGNIRPYVGDKDIGMVFSVGDLLGGPNPVTGPILANAVAAVVGMVEHGHEDHRQNRESGPSP